MVFKRYRVTFNYGDQRLEYRYFTRKSAMDFFMGCPDATLWWYIDGTWLNIGARHGGKIIYSNWRPE